MSNSEIRLAIPAEKVRSYSMDSDTTEKNAGYAWRGIYR